MAGKKKPRGVGRPSLSGKGPARRVEIKVAPATYDQWATAAEREGLTLAEWLRAAAELAIARGSTR